MPTTEEQKVNATVGQELDLPCSKCTGKTAHEVLASVDRSGAQGDGNNEYSWDVHDQIVQCRGCRIVSFRRVTSDSEDYDRDDDGGVYYHERERLYPSRIEGRRDIGDDAFYLPSTVRGIYDETVSALANEAPILTGIGLRALLESVCKERAAKGRSLFEQIDDLVQQRVLTPAGASILHKIRTLGNSAAHEVKPHSEKQLGLAMNIVEHVLKDVYILPKQAQAEFGDEFSEVTPAK